LDEGGRRRYVLLDNRYFRGCGGVRIGSSSPNWALYIAVVVAVTNEDGEAADRNFVETSRDAGHDSSFEYVGAVPA